VGGDRRVLRSARPAARSLNSGSRDRPRSQQHARNHFADSSAEGRTSTDTADHCVGRDMVEDSPVLVASLLAVSRSCVHASRIVSSPKHRITSLATVLVGLSQLRQISLPCPPAVER